MDQAPDQYYLHGLIALISCCFQIGILSAVITRSRLTSAFNLLCIVLIFRSALDFLSATLYATNPDITYQLMDGSMLGTIFFGVALVYFSVTVAQIRYASQLVGLFAASGILVACLQPLGLLASGYTAVSYTIIREPGPMFWVFKLHIMGAALTSLGTLIWGAITASPEQQARCKTSLIAILPLCALALGVLILRAEGYNASASIGVAFVSTFFVWILMMDERGEFVTFKVKSSIIFRLVTNIKNLKLDDWADEVEKLLIIEAMRATNNNKSAAARLLSINQTTFHRKAEKHLEKEKSDNKVSNTKDSSEKDYDYL
jgi:hypothetical protein